MIIYNFFLFIGSRETDYLNLTIFLITYTIASALSNGFGLQFFWPNTPTFNNGLSVITPIAGIVGFTFTITFLGIRRHTPAIFKMSIVFIIIFTCIILSNFFLPYKISLKAALTFHSFASLALFIISLYYLKIRFRRALFFVPAWSFLLFGVTITILKNTISLPINIITIWGTYIGGILMVILFSLGLADKLNRLKNDLQELNENLEDKVKMRTEELEASYSELEATNEQLLITRDALWGEMEIAKKIQTVLLPKKPEIQGFEISTYMKPADEVGGDYYDIINVANRDWVVIGDVSGHGLSAGLIMMMVQTSINTVIEQNPEIDPSKLLAIINNSIRKNIEKLNENKYMTITVFAIFEKGRFTFSGLHQDILIYRKKNQSVESIETQGMWIGMIDDLGDMQINNSLYMDQGDIMLLYTDGITEAWLKGSVKDHRSPEFAMFGEKKLIKILQQSGEKSTDEVLKLIIQECEAYSVDDDVTLVMLKKI